MKNDDQPEPRNLPFNPHTEVESYLERSRLSLLQSLDKYQMAGWPIELCFPNHLAAVHAGK